MLFSIFSKRKQHRVEAEEPFCFRGTVLVKLGVEAFNELDLREAREPDLYPQDEEFYIQCYRECASIERKLLRSRKTARSEECAKATSALNFCVHALCTKGGHKARRMAEAMLQSSSPREREDGACILGALKDKDSASVHLLAERLGTETDLVAASALIASLADHGKAAIPYLSEYLRRDAVDPDLLWGAALGLGKAVGEAFDSGGKDAVIEARKWLDEQGTPGSHLRH